MRCFKTMILLAVIMTFLLPFTSNASSNYIADKYRSDAQKWDQRLHAAEKALLDMPKEEWDEGTLTAYLNCACYSVYCALVSYMMTNDEAPADATMAASYGLSAWPKNPCNNWEPIRVLSATEPFSAGDLVYQIAPPSHYSLVFNPGSGYSTAPQSFEIGIFGPSIDHHQGFTDGTRDGNTWATLPRGLVMNTGAWTEQAEVTLKKMEERLAKQKETEGNPVSGEGE
jgi:hypothetical protein